MAPTPHARPAARGATVYGEPITELLPALVAICSESAATRAVAERLQRVARALGVTGTTIAERALLLGQLTAATPCRCRGVG